MGKDPRNQAVAGSWQKEDQPTYRRKIKAAALGFGHKGRVTDYELLIADCYQEQTSREFHGIPANATSHEHGRKRRHKKQIPSDQRTRWYLET